MPLLWKAPSRVAISSALSRSEDALALERALEILLAPGMGSITFEEARSQARATS